MSKIEKTFQQLARKGEKPFIPFLMAGDPDFKTSKKLVLEAERQGADIIELGIPYSAPLADGPTIKQASKRSLRHNTNLDDIFSLVTEIRKESSVPLVLMGYYNSVFNYGLTSFIEQCEKAGVDGTIIPDLPLGEDKELRELSTQLDIILLISSTSTDRRIKKVAQASQGFIYAVSQPGTTGTRAEVSKEVKTVVKQLKDFTTTPVAVGFGISSPQHVKEIAQFADGTIVGSAIIKRLAENLDLLPEKRDKLVTKVGDFIAQLKEPLKTRDKI